jgi:glutaredoxin 3
VARVTVYTTSWCGPCRRAKDLLRRKGVPFTEVDVEEVPGAREEMERRSGRITVPQVFAGDRHLGGCDDLHRLDARGELDALLR